MRNRKSKLIAFLFVALVFMGIGYAALQTNLNISGTAKASGTFRVEIFSITETQDSISNGGVTTKSATRNATNTEATFDTTFVKPGDYVEYKVTIKNTGTIDAVIDMEIDDSDNEDDGQGNDIFLFDVKDDTTGHKIKKNTAQNIILEAGQSRVFTVKISFNSKATTFPSQVISFVLTTEAQQIGSRTIENLIEDEDDELDYTVDSNGLLLTYSLKKAQHDQDGYLLVPAVNEEGEQIKYIDNNSFSKGNVLGFYLYGFSTGNSASGYVILDDENYDAIEEALEESNKTPIYTLSEYEELKNEIDTIENLYNHREDAYLDLETGEIKTPIRETKIDLSDAVYLEEIRNSTFQNGPLVGIKLPQNGVLSLLGNYSFYGNPISGTLTIPSSLTTIGNGAFHGNQINTLNLSNATSLETIGNDAFYGNQLSGTLTIPSSVTSIGTEAFRGPNNNFTLLTIPNSVTTIGSDAFRYNTIQSLSIDMINIPSDIFNEKSIQTLTLGSHVETIGSKAFKNNQISGTITISSSVTSIGDNAFSSGNLLSGLDLSNATSLETIEDYAFSTNRLSGLDLSNATSLETIGAHAFSGNQLSGTLTIPSSVTSIGIYAFNGLLASPTNRLSSLDLTNASSLQTIGTGAFEYNQLSGILTIPSSVTSIGISAFRSECGGNSSSSNNLSGLDLSNATSLETIGDYAFICNQMSSLNLSNATNLQTIGNYSFSGIQLNGTLTIPSNVTSIGNYAFSNSQLTSLTIPNSVTTIGNGAFNILASLSIDMTTIPSGIFNDKNIQSLTLGNHVQTIADQAFEGCNFSGTLTIPNSVTSIGSNAFADNKIEILNIGSGLTTLGSNAFRWQYDDTLGQYTLTTININMTSATWNSRNLPTTGWYSISGSLPTVTYNQS